MKLLLPLSVAALLGLPLAACGQASALDRTAHLPGRVVVGARVGPRSIRSSELSIYLETIRRRRGVVTPRSTNPPRRTTTASRLVVDVPVSGRGDGSCLQTLQANGVAYDHKPAMRGLAAPLEIVGPVGGVRLLARAGRAPIMDCELARALAEAGPLFRQLGITGLSFSGAYDYRTRRGSTRLSEHAHGLAIDVHAFETDVGQVNVARDFQRDPLHWQGIERRPNLAACVGNPTTPQGQLLRNLACQLKAHPGFNVILTPDDNDDHRDHFHIEAYPSRSRELYSARPRPVHNGRRQQAATRTRHSAR